MEFSVCFRERISTVKVLKKKMCSALKLSKVTGSNCSFETEWIISASNKVTETATQCHIAKCKL